MPFFHVITATRRRIIDDLREVFGNHPVYQKVEIQDKFAFDERPQFAIIVQNSTVGRVQLSASNFTGNLQSHVKLAKVEDQLGQFLEWVREDTLAIEKNNGVFPTPPGFYFVELTSKTEFVIDPLFKVELEVLIESALGGETVFQLANCPILSGSFELFLSGIFTPLCEGHDYFLNPNTGELVLVNPLAEGDKLAASYQVPGTTIGPVVFKENMSNNTALPGVVLAFGRRIEVGDRVVVIVGQTRENVARVFGGRWDISFTLDCVSRDSIQRDEIADECLIALWINKKPILEADGILLSDIGMSGESEEVYDENTDDYYFKSTIDFTVQTDWELAVPIVNEVRAINLVTGIDSSGNQLSWNDFCLLTDEQLAEMELGIKALGPDCPVGIKNFYLQSTPHNSATDRRFALLAPMFPSERVFFPGKTINLERII